MSVFWRSWLTVVILVAIVLAVLATLTTLQFDTILSHFVHGRLSVLAQTSRASFRAAVGLGLPLSAVRNAPAILERALQTDPNISAVHVFDVSGTILHSTDPNHTTSVRAEALFAQSTSEGDTWHAETDEHLLSGGPIRDLSRKTVGGLVIVYPKTDLSTSVDAMTARLAIHAFVVLVVIAGIGVGILRFGLRDLVRVFTGSPSRSHPRNPSRGAKSRRKKRTRIPRLIDEVAHHHEPRPFGRSRLYCSRSLQDCDI